MFSNVRELMKLMRMPTAPELGALQERHHHPAPLMMLFGPDRQTTMLDDFLITVLDDRHSFEDLDQRRMGKPVTRKWSTDFFLRETSSREEIGK